MNTKDTSVDELIAALERHAGLVRAAQSCTEIPREEGQRIVKALSRAGVKHGALVAISSLLAQCAVLTIRLARLEARCEAIDAAVKGATAPLVARIVALESASAASLKMLEERPGLLYRGVWITGEYAPGDCVTQDGSLWIAKAKTRNPPGGGCKDWQLAVKRGRDGRSAR